MPALSNASTPSGMPAIHLAGDSTMAAYGPDKAPMQGWGQRLEDFVRPGVAVRNHAAPGRSTLSFRREGRWDKLLEGVRAGDFVLIQFGHNDQKKDQPELYADAESDYPENLRRFVGEAREKGGRPVLVTSIYRRHFRDGVLVASLGIYPEAMRRVARRTDTPLVDLQEATGRLFSEAGDVGSTAYFTHTAPGEYPGYPEGVKDDSHPNAHGARTIARLFALASLRDGLEISACLSTSGDDTP